MHRLQVSAIMMMVLLRSLPWCAGRTVQAAEKDSARTGESQGALAERLQNPVADLISIPFQSNFEFNAGEDDDAFRYLLNIQPVIPFTLNENWNLITRTIVPVVYQDALFAGSNSEFGLGDTTLSLFLSPKEGPGGWIVGAGPVLLLPTATDDLLGLDQWGAGPTAVVLRQEMGWTYGLLANHVWSFAGDDDRGDISSTFLQPFLSRTWENGFTVGANTEAIYDWEIDEWTVPVQLQASQLIVAGRQPLSLQLGGRYYAAAPQGAPEWGIRFTVTLLFPK